jgi:transposase
LLTATAKVQVYIYRTPVDMRKSFDTLAALVRHGLGRDVLSGDYFLFVAKNRTRAKVLCWDGTGLCLYSKRLESGHFSAPWQNHEQSVIRMTLPELELFLEGSSLAGKVLLSPPPFLLTSVKNQRK